MKYSLGLDIGTTSVGWAVVNLDAERIEDLGVRIFERPENPKDGKSLAEPRRTARGARRRLRRRRQRLNCLKRFFVENELLTEDEINAILTPRKDAKNPYELREKALRDKLENDELFIALYHIAKRRGYKSNRKSVEEKDTEGSKVLSAISENKQYLVKYQTVAVALNNADKFETHKRNKADDYNNSFIREDFLGEIQDILQTQQKYHKELTDDKIDELLNKTNYGLFYQRPFMTAELIEKMRGKCPFEKDQPRAQKASLTFEMFRLAQDLAHLTYNNGQKLTPEEIDMCIGKAKNIKTVKYTHIREILGRKKDPDFEFDYIRGAQFKKITDPNDKNKKIYDPKFDPQTNKFCELAFYHKVADALKDLPKDWNVVENDVDLFDEIGYILTANKDDESIKKKLSNLNKLSENAIDNLVKLSFSGFGHLSIKALRNITPWLLKGYSYRGGNENEKGAVQMAGYDDQQQLSGKQNKLPPLNEDEQNQITNPVVKRAISQTIKVVNAVIRKHGAPTRISIECANDLAKNFKDRNDIKKSQDENAAQNEKIVDRLKNEFNVTNPTGLQITKFKFYNEQNGKCPYCVKPLDINRIFADEHYGEVDHIVPFSRCGNDGRGNKVLVHNECNQNKRNQTPYETWGTDDERWTLIENFAKATYFGSNYRKQQRLLAKTLPKEDWNARALNDTRYITKFMSQFVRKNLKFSDEGDGKQKVFTPTGGITSHLRRIWHIGTKDRDENNLHHAVDAAIVALVDQGVIQNVSTLNKYYELFTGNGENEVTDRFTGEILKRGDIEKWRENVLPWSDFDKEIRLRTSQIKDEDNLTIWRDQFRDLYKDQDGDFRDNVHPIFVSRMPKRNGTGQAHKETIRSPKVKDGDQRTTRKRLSDIHLKDLENSVLKESDLVLYHQLEDLLKKSGDDPKKAFNESYTDSDGKQKIRPLAIYKGGKSYGIIRDKTTKKEIGRTKISPVSTIKVYSTEPSGFLINDGKAFVNNGSTIRLDIYQHECGIFAAPIYTHLVRAEEVPILPTPNGRSRTEKEYWDKLRNDDSKIYATEDNGFVKLFGVYPNDYLKIETKTGEQKEGYYVKYGVTGGQISLLSHTSSNKESFISVNVGTVENIERLDVSVLGDNYPWG